VRAELDIVEHVTGDRPHTCPWWSYKDPDVVEVLNAYDWFESGQCAEHWGPDPEWWLVEGVRHYHRVLGRVRADAMRLERETKSSPARLPPGFVAEHEIRG